ncbi:MAG TPA: hypothetical protein VGG69_01560 [Rhizomicrobium sp.]|jgi:hypothetical protein
MIAPDQSKAKTAREVDGHPSEALDLPFRIELWDEDKRAVECVVARAHSATLARAIFKAACEQFPGRHLALWQGPEQLAARED